MIEALYKELNKEWESREWRYGRNKGPVSFEYTAQKHL